MDSDARRFRCIGGPQAGAVITLDANDARYSYRFPLPQRQRTWWKASLFPAPTFPRYATYDLHTTADGIRLALYRGDS
jgi:hypothetical protein